MTRQDVAGGVVVAACVAALLAYRDAYVEPRVWGAACASATPPAGCILRAALLWLQYHGLWGLGALALGLWAFLGGPFGAAVGGVALGGAAAVNYNATFGVLGATLAAWAWIRREHASASPPRISAAGAPRGSARRPSRPAPRD